MACPMRKTNACGGKKLTLSSSPSGLFSPRTVSTSINQCFTLTFAIHQNVFKIDKKKTMKVL